MNWWTQLSAQVQPELEIFNIRLHYYGIFIALGSLLAIWLAQIRSKQYQLKRSDVESAIWWIFLPGIAGARIYHVLDNLPYYLLRPFDIVAIWKGGLGIWGALIGGIGGLIYAGHKQQIKIWPMLDLAAPSVALAQAIGRWGNFFNMEGYGPPTELPWKIFITPGRRLPEYLSYIYFHPMFLYESIWDFSVFVTLILISRKQHKPGVVAAWYLILYGVGRFVLEFGRIDTAILWGIKVAQVISIIAVIIGISIWHWAIRKKFNKSE